ncbi:type IV secretion protein Rhs [Lentzea alba]|uniref:polymorphic toxin-type HINT domain-containing protein n=1 Tax=Lentzea alba TaxID=2714351 RepID=UPI0039BF2692
MSSTLPKRGLAVALVASLVSTVLAATPALAAPYKPPTPQKERVVAGKKLGVGTAEDVRTGTAFTGSAPVWPKAGVAEVEAVSVAQKKVADTPLSVAAADVEAAKAKPKVKIETFDREKTRKAGVYGVLFKVSGGSAKVEVDYSSFRWAYGGDWSSRLRLVELPECALTTPGKPECAAKPVASRNDPAKRTVTATEASPAGGAFMALAAGTSSGSGTYSATSLAPSATWSAGSNTGDFSWNYPLRMPPSLGGPTPSLALAYSSSSVDGRMAASNNQPSWIGEGFELGANFIERRYIGCADDMGTGARNTTKTGDLCWRNENAALSMAGHAGELIKESGNRWRLRNDDGTRVEFRTGASNGARNGEHWVVTTPDGTQNWFGRGTQSVLNVPVAGNHAGEPCAANAFKDSFCAQPYRWNLEYVVDLNGNTMSFSYDKETNKYARNNTETDLAQYDRAAVLKQIDYGTRADRTETAPMQVVFEPADRCLANCGTKNATNWPDVPWDQECNASPCRVGSPTFWMTKRLAAVTTKVGGNLVEKWTLGHSFPDPGDGTRAGLWLDKVSHQGLVGETVTRPDIRFGGIQLSNRVDTHSDQHAAMKWWRLKTIHTETGGRVDVTYSDPDCVVGSRMPNPNALQDNNLRCYPVRWTPEGNTTPIWDYFHKYVVKSVTETDLTGGAVRVLTQYEYVGDPAWHYTDDDGFIKAEDKTWSDWRGYSAVRAMKGDPGEQTLTETRYFRGMHGDKLPSGTRNVSLPAIAVGNVPAVVDEDVFAGMPREEITYNGPGGAEVSATVNEPWRSEPTATRTINGITTYARYVNTAVKHARTALDGGRGHLTTSVSTEFDQTYGMPVRTEDRGDTSVTGDEKCKLFDYARNTSSWLIEEVSREREFLVDCAKAQAGTGLVDADVSGDTKTYYDGQDLGAAPTKGDATKTEELKSYVNGVASYQTTKTVEYDNYGRVTKLTDLKGATSTAYTPAQGGPVTQTTATNSLGWVTTTTKQPAWDLPSSIVDSNQWRTDITYDGLGRTTAVWMPGYDKNSVPANKKFSYLERVNGPVAVTTSSINADGQYNTSIQLFDGLLRPRQTQKLDASGSTTNAVVTDAYYDSAGRSVRSNNEYLANVAPSTELFVPTDTIPSGAVTSYDGAGREIVEKLKKSLPVASPGGEDLAVTTTYYAGDRTDITPPAGGVVSSTLTDALGRTSEVRQYHAGVAAGSASGFDATKYTYDREDKLRKVVDPTGKTWEYDYDLRGRQYRTVDPDKGLITSVYDDSDQLLSTTDARGKTLAYTYDELGRKTSMRDDSPTGPLRAEWFYDVLADGNRVNGQLVKSVRHGELGAYVKENIGVRSDGQPTATDFTVPAGETGLAGTYSYVFTYNADGSLYTTRIPAMGDLQRETLQYGYDGLGQAKTQKSGYGTKAQTDLVTNTGYTSFGELASYRLRNSGGSTVDITRNYDQHTRRLNQIWTTRQTGPTDVANVSYSYDTYGNVTRIADSVSADTQCFRTDYLRRLTEAWTPASGDCAPDPTVAGLGGPSKYWQSFTYNSAGDRTKLVEHGTSAGDRTTTYTPTPGKHSLAGTSTSDTAGTRNVSYSYDESGNLLTRPAPTTGTQTLTWDQEGHVATTVDESGASSYVYDADGNRLIRRDPTGRTLYLPGQELRYTASSGAKSCTRYYTHAGQNIAMRTSTGLTWMSSDQHGTAENTINALNQVVSTRRTLPFGEVRGGTGTWPAKLDKGFVGGTLDNTGLTHIGAREYDPAIGRFVSVDPEIDNADPQQMHGYAYGNNNPLSYVDSDGRWSIGGAFRAVGNAVGSAAKAVGNTVKTAVVNTVKSIKEDPLKFVTGVVVGAAAAVAVGAVCATGVGCLLLAGAVAGAAAAGAEYGTDVARGRKEFSVGELGKEMAIGAAVGGVTAGLGVVGGKVLNKARQAMRKGGDKVADDAARSTPPAEPRGKCNGAHSFAPATLVMLANGTTKPIKDVQRGDEVLATEPRTGETVAKPVTELHRNVDFDLTDLDVVSAGGKVETIETTWTHPFWDATDGKWAFASLLVPGHELRTADGVSMIVKSVRNRVGNKVMRDLTVAEFHTYHVMAAGSPVLVHNCGTGSELPGTVRRNHLDDDEYKQAQEFVRDHKGHFEGQQTKHLQTIDGHYNGHPVSLKSVNTNKRSTFIRMLVKAKKDVAKTPQHMGLHLIVRAPFLGTRAIASVKLIRVFIQQGWFGKVSIRQANGHWMHYSKRPS